MNRTAIRARAASPTGRRARSPREAAWRWTPHKPRTAAPKAQPEAGQPGGVHAAQNAPQRPRGCEHVREPPLRRAGARARPSGPAGPGLVRSSTGAAAGHRPGASSRATSRRSRMSWTARRSRTRRLTRPPGTVSLHDAAGRRVPWGDRRPVAARNDVNARTSATRTSRRSRTSSARRAGAGNAYFGGLQTAGSAAELGQKTRIGQEQAGVATDKGLYKSQYVTDAKDTERKYGLENAAFERIQKQLGPSGTGVKPAAPKGPNGETPAARRSASRASATSQARRSGGSTTSTAAGALPQAEGHAVPGKGAKPRPPTPAEVTERIIKEGFKTPELHLARLSVSTSGSARPTSRWLTGSGSVSRPSCVPAAASRRRTTDGAGHRQEQARRPPVPEVLDARSRALSAPTPR
jgi:hypothetical protein